METIALTAQKRPSGTKGTLNALRREGRVPAILYGLKGEPELLDVNAVDLRPLFVRRNPIVALSMEGKTQLAILKQVDRDPIRDHVTHIDFLRVDETQPVTVTVAVIPVGTAVGVKLDGGVFRVARRDVKLKAKIQDIPANFTVDITEMRQGQKTFVRDLKFTKGTFITPARTVIFGVGEAHVEEVVAAPVAAAVAAPTTGAPGAPGVAPSDKAAAAAPAGGKDKGAPPAAGKDKGAAPAAGKGGGKPSK